MSSMVYMMVPAEEFDTLLRDAWRWRAMRHRLTAASIVSGRHNSGQEHHCPIDEACTDAYWDKLADRALAMDKAALAASQERGEG